MPISPLQLLTVVPVADLVLHEAVEPRRAAAVVAGMARSGVLTDPVVAVPGPDGRWLVLDGAHRTTALTTLGVGMALVQRMHLDGLTPVPGPDPDATPARVDAWAHDIRDVDPATLLDGAAGVRGGPAVVATVTGGGRTAVVRSGASLDERLAAMWALARRYDGAEYVRSQHDDPPREGAGVRVSWSPVEAADLLELAARKAEFPAGISRFVLPGRLLGLRVPLADLRRAGTASGTVDPAVAGALLQRLRELPIRHYREPVWVVETSQPAFLTDEDRVDPVAAGRRSGG